MIEKTNALSYFSKYATFNICIFLFNTKKCNLFTQDYFLVQKFQTIYCKRESSRGFFHCKSCCLHTVINKTIALLSIAS